MTRPLILVLEWLPEGELAHWVKEFSACEFIEARKPELVDQHLPKAEIAYGLPPLDKLARAEKLRWIQLISAGVPQALCPLAKKQEWAVTNLAGLYGPSIAEHAVGLMIMLSRNYHIAQRQQRERLWERALSRTMVDLRGKTLGLVGLGNIGQNIARLGHAFGMRVVGCRRVPRPAPFVDQVFPQADMKAMLAEADYLAVAAPLTSRTEGMLGLAEFQALKKGAYYINISRGPVAQEPALIQALQSGHLAGAGLDVFAVEPLAPENPLWTMPNVIVTPHYSGETVNQSAQPAQRFTRNLRARLAGQKLEGVVDLDAGY